MEKNLYLIGNAHLDPIWLWKKSEGLSEILSTFRSALDRMKEFPDYIFTSACASYYQWVEQIDQEMFREIQQRVAEGRWSITGGFWVQPDCNIPSGESFARHILYSQRYFQEKFGITARSGYNVDSFGHGGMLPQLLRLGGMDSYVFMRPEQKESPALPNLFWWEAPDGSRVLTHKIEMGYAENWLEKGEEEPAVSKAKALRRYAEQYEQPYMVFYGVGNHGGGPTIRGLRALEETVAQQSDICFASVRQYFDAVLAEETAEELPVIKGDLRHHASGCYAANAGIKAANRRAENALLKAERYSSMASRLLRDGDEQQALENAWKKVLFNQFHDVLAGCCIREADVEALDGYAYACETASELTNRALHRLSWNINTTKGIDAEASQKNGWILWEKSGEGAPVVVFNPHVFPVKTAVQLNLTVDGITDLDGNTVVSQHIRGPQTNQADVTNTLFSVQLPALGYAVYYLHQRPVPQCGAVPGLCCAKENVLENARLRLTFDPADGSIASFYDKAGKTEFSAGKMARAIVIDDTESDTWGHGRFVFDREIGCFDNAEITILENGPLRSGLRVITHYQASTLTQDFLLTVDSDIVDVRCKIDFHEHLKLVKLSLPVLMEQPRVNCSTAYGFLDKGVSETEDACQEWIRLYSPAKRSLTICNDSKYSYCTVPFDGGAELRMTVARGAIYADHFGVRDDLVEFQDQGEHRFAYSLSPNKDEAESARYAELLNMPLDVLLETHHRGSLPADYSGFEISNTAIKINVIKKAEDNDDIILRVVETAGKNSRSTIVSPLLGLTFDVECRPQQIKTLRVDLKNKQVTEESVTESGKREGYR